MGKQERIDRAVLDLNGVWPEVSQHFSHEDGYSVYWYNADHLVYECKTAICTKSEFMEARKRLFKDKDVDKIDWSKAPDGYDYWVEDLMGSKPSDFHRLCVDRYVDQEGMHWSVGSERIFVVNRPQPDHEEGEGVEWEPGVDLPPVGTVCEVDDGFKGWRKCEIIAHFEQPSGMVAVFTVGDTGTGKRVDFYGPTCFRPIQSHRDKVIEAADKVANAVYVKVPQSLLHEWYDAGILKLPEDSQ